MIEEYPRRLKPEEGGCYHKEFQDYLYADAHCGDCGAKYLAWVGGDPSGSRSTRLGRGPDGLGSHFYDLSYRSTFNDEPGTSDLPPWFLTEAMAKFRDGDCSADMVDELGLLAEFLRLYWMQLDEAECIPEPILRAADLSKQIRATMDEVQSPQPDPAPLGLRGERKISGPSGYEGEEKPSGSS